MTIANSPTEPRSHLKTFQMVERKDPAFITFSKGVQIEGVLDRIDHIPVGEERKLCARYRLMDLDTGAMTVFLGTAYLDGKLSRRDIGKYLGIACIGEDQNAGRNGNAMKTFAVYVSTLDVPVHVADGAPIVNEDIGF